MRVEIYIKRNSIFFMGSKRKMSEMNSSKTLNLDMDIDFVPKTISNVLSEVSMIRGFSMKSSLLDFHIRLLEKELKKVESFKRELPCCMQLLQDASERLKKESLRLREIEERGMEVREELLPVESGEERKGGAEASNNINGDKKTWMSRVRLWTAPLHFHNNADDDTFPFKSGGAVEALKRPLGMTRMKEEKRGVPVEEVSVSVVPVEAVDLSHFKKKQQRRCWSPELHKLFLDALLHLGGPNVATPKQIRDAMKVEGLTNDEVKSHLQKYRLHIKKLPAAGSSAGNTSTDACEVDDVAPEVDKSVNHA